MNYFSYHKTAFHLFKTFPDKRKPGGGYGQWPGWLRRNFQNKKDPSLNSTSCSAELWDPTSLQGFTWSLSKAVPSTLVQCWPWGSQVADKKQNYLIVPLNFIIWKWAENTGFLNVFKNLNMAVTWMFCQYPDNVECLVFAYNVTLSFFTAKGKDTSKKMAWLFLNLREIMSHSVSLLEIWSNS